MIKKIKQCPLFITKNYNRNGKDTPKIQIGITSFAYKISTQVFRVRWGFRDRRFQKCYQKFLGIQGNCQGNKIWAKISKKMHRFQFCAKKRGLFIRIVRFSGLANLIMLSEIIKELRGLPWQPNLGKNKQKMHRFQFCAKLRNFSHEQ